MLFVEAATLYLANYTAKYAGIRSSGSMAERKRLISNTMLQFLGSHRISSIDDVLLREYFAARTQNSINNCPISPNTIHHETSIIRQILKYAVQCGYLHQLPEFNSLRSIERVVIQSGFSTDEWRDLLAACKKRAADPPRQRWKKECLNLYDYVIFMEGTGLPPSDAERLTVRDVAYPSRVKQKDVGVEITVKRRGQDAIIPASMDVGEALGRVVRRNNLVNDQDRLFKTTPSYLLNKVLEDLGLKMDSVGKKRSVHSLRNTYIFRRLQEGADLNEISKHCDISLRHLDRYYARHSLTAYRLRNST